MICQIAKIISYIDQKLMISFYYKLIELTKVLWDIELYPINYTDPVKGLIFAIVK